ncbi:hypothetical protein K458DRAFT_469416 [Lentithecium fluviatile CBS 122367]|uniref:Zn(2)-C6 fungal-type domain-containing protein n=1 Tax=Lentithecium fluviatile CBS 122367 TaxID=1168545 RepID=A0A6G1JAU8_9PLEO|nr:hypothetical protein K458DRAFT_469416 [Lentithecium fluviatile CBS 122367]
MPSGGSKRLEIILLFCTSQPFPMSTVGSGCLANAITSPLSGPSSWYLWRPTALSSRFPDVTLPPSRRNSIGATIFSSVILLLQFSSVLSESPLASLFVSVVTMSSAGVEKRGSAATVKACDSCRKRKRRCYWTSGADRCTYCTQLKEECTTTHVRKQRGKQQKRDRITEYEHRIKNLETLLQDRSAAQPHVQEQPLQRADQSIPLSTWVDNLRTEVNSFPVAAPSDVDPNAYNGPVAAYENEPLSAATGDSDTTNANMGAETSSFPPVAFDVESFEPSADFQEEANLLQDPFFQPPAPLAASLNDLSLLDPPLETPPEEASACSSLLPSPELGASLLSEFLVDFNTVFPLYRPYTVADHLRICYEGGSDGSALAWATAYVVLGIAHRSRGMSAFATPQDNLMADWYLCRILPTVSGLLVAPPSLGLVQCLLGLSMLIRSSANSTPHALFVSTALRISQTLAYEYFNVDCADTEQDAQDVEQQRRVFWLAFIQDTDEAILSNVPTTQRREDITTDLPDADPVDSLGAVKAAEGDWKVNLFALRIRLVLLQAEAIEHVLAIKPRKTTPADMTATVDRVLTRLEKWRDNDVCRLSPAELTQLLYRSDLIHVLSVEASYFATVFRLRAFLVLGLDPRVNPFSTKALGRLAAQTKHAAFVEAERLLGLLGQTPHGDIGICWMIKLPIIAALVTVLSHHLHTLTPTLSPSTTTSLNLNPNPNPIVTPPAPTPTISPPPPTIPSRTNSLPIPTSTSTPISEPSLEATPSLETMRSYMHILRTLGTLAQQSQDIELQRARELCMMLYTKVETGLRIRWLNRRVDLGASGEAQALATGAEVRL